MCFMYYRNAGQSESKEHKLKSIVWRFAASGVWRFAFISLRINSHLSFPGKPVPSEELIYVFMFDYLFNIDRMRQKRGDIFRSGQ